MVCQIAAVMEIIHPLLGFVKTSPLMPFFQVELIGSCHITWKISTVEPVFYGRHGIRPHPGPKFLHFHAVFRKKNWSNSRLAAPLGNPGSATGHLIRWPLSMLDPKKLWPLLFINIPWVFNGQHIFVRKRQDFLWWSFFNHRLKIFKID